MDRTSAAGGNRHLVGGWLWPRVVGSSDRGPDPSRGWRAWGRGQEPRRGQDRSGPVWSWASPATLDNYIDMLLWLDIMGSFRYLKSEKWIGISEEVLKHKHAQNHGHSWRSCHIALAKCNCEDEMWYWQCSVLRCCHQTLRQYSWWAIIFLCIADLERLLRHPCHFLNFPRSVM